MVLGLPKVYRINTNVKSKIMLIMEIKFKQRTEAAIVHCPEKNTLQFRDRKYLE